MPLLGTSRRRLALGAALCALTCGERSRGGGAGGGAALPCLPARRRSLPGRRCVSCASKMSGQRRGGCRNPLVSDQLPWFLMLKQDCFN
ncbi:platelet-activating factor acetylhydrolase IB subunit beta [Platysternon megacephalum]|uniref:Platelet-activating factor acetylhydrolase IB subunit beta n=1 Tax=Platysternon megacephalum TaxID=55544 RepID=A0A4D9E874_9SAUR|nr:platelet-activating factor acetylhydrolase IB subunit beta [Platysternon megacephalum]